MIQLNSAIEILENKIGQLSKEKCALQDSLGKVLAEDVFSDIDMPPFDKSAMDGFACRKSDIGKKLKIIETIPAGYVSIKKVEEGSCSKIMTGAKIPEGADIVVMIEDCEVIEDKYIICGNSNSKRNICNRAEDIAKGDKVINKNTIIQPQHIAIMASVGYVNPVVYKTPKVGVIATGTELVESYQKPSDSKIRNSNSDMIMAQLRNIGINGTYYGIAIDTEFEIKQCLKQALIENDGIIVTGGVSVGEFDLVPKILSELSLEINFSAIAIQPGKPVKFATNESKFCFALSGNPVSSMLQFRLLVKPFMFKLMGKSLENEVVKLELLEDFSRKSDARTQFVPVKFNSNGVSLLDFNGSAHIYAFANAQAYLEIPQGVKEIKKGSIVDVRSIQ